MAGWNEDPDNRPGGADDGNVERLDTADDEWWEETPHVGHFSRLGGTWWCDTCDSPYCELA